MENATLIYNERTGMFEEVPVNPQIISFSFDGSPERYKDENVIFKWEVQDAQKIFINDVEVPVSSSSYSYTLLDVGLQDFVLRIETGGLQKTASLQLKVIDVPVFRIEQSAYKLRKDKNESCRIKWNILYSQTIKLICDNVEESIGAEGELTVFPNESTDYKFEALGIDGTRLFSYTVRVDVFEESVVLFEADKNITLPHVPIKLSWDVKNASDVELTDYGKVNHSGEKKVECDRDKTFTLKVTDMFGISEYHQRIRMYPLPLIRSILVPVPHIEKNLNVETHFEQKHLQVDINVNMAKIPDIAGIKADVFVPTIPIHQLQLSPRKDWWDKLQDYNKKLTKRVTEKISSLWNRQTII